MSAPRGSGYRMRSGELVLVVAALLLLVAALVGVAWTSGPSSLLPQTGRVFAPATSTASPAPAGSACELVVGPAHAYCRQGSQPQSASAAEDVRGPAALRVAVGVLGLAAVAVGVGVLVMLRRRP
ncbi:hypothetical protein ACFY0Z_29445 [Streptomyces kronopolitis]|uniref:hypothetical protein n=1 Tax=Streptomyces kronopolitis TaxID=1612435 RepID=UPI0036961AB2